MKLFCWHEHHIHPYFKVGPLKLELLSMHPKAEVVIVHKVLGEGLLEFLRNDTGRNYSVCGSEDSKMCLYATTKLPENSSQGALRTLQIASRISGLKLTGRPVMVTVSAAGGHHPAHVDAVSFLICVYLFSHSHRLGFSQCHFELWFKTTRSMGVMRRHTEL